MSTAETIEGELPNPMTSDEKENLKQVSVLAVGGEFVNHFNIRFLVTVASIGIMILLFVVAAVDIGFFSSYPGSLPGIYGWLAIVLTLFGVIGWWFAITYIHSKPATYQVDFVSHPEGVSPNKLAVRYINQATKRENRFVVKEIQPVPSEGLYRIYPLANVPAWVKGTVASMRIIPAKGSAYILCLGFASLDEMKKVYLELSSQATDL